MISRNLFRLAVVALCTSFTGFMACGGGGGGDGTSSVPALRTTFRGSLSTNSSLSGARGSNSIPGVSVSAFGESSTTDANGEWSFEASTAGSTGVDVAFSFSGGGFSTSAVVPAVPTGSSLVEIEFLSNSDRLVSVDQVIADGSLVFEGDTMDPVDDDVSTVDPSDPCSILRNTNITFVEISEQIVTPEPPDSNCGETIERLVAIGNPQVVAFDYLISADPAFVVLSEPSGTLLPGEIVVIEAVKNCGEGGIDDVSLYDFTPEEGEDVDAVDGDAILTVQVDITSLAPEGAEVVSAADAVEACGSNSPIGNLTEQVMIPAVFDTIP